MVKLTVLAENSVGVSLGQVAEHGWSVLLEDGQSRVLFDTGQGSCLAVNPRLLGVDLSRLDAIVLSHGHYDHTRGLKPALAAGSGAPIYCHPLALQKKKVRRSVAGREVTLDIGLPYSKAEIEGWGGRFEFITGPTRLSEHIWTSGEIPLQMEFERLEPGFLVENEQGEALDPFLDDLALWVRTEKGLSVILGCAHRGAINTLHAAAAWSGGAPFFAVVGGNHLHSRSAEQVAETLSGLERFQPRLLAPAHCTGPRVAAQILERFGERAAPVSVGWQLEL